MAAPTPNALQQLGALILGNHALNLEQEVVLRRAANRMVQEYDVRSCAAKLLDQKHLVGVAASQPVRRVHIDAIESSASHRIPQLLQRRTPQVCAAVTMIHI